MIPLKLETLLDGRVVEQDRVEYKQGWNPTDTIQAICAYANDFSNMNGGYVVVDIEEDNGRPLLPPVGVDENSLDRIQNELFQYCNLIEPGYLPQLEIVEYTGKKLICLWCSAGDAGPYSAPYDVLSKSREGRRKEYWIKPFSVKTSANQSEKFELFNKFNAVPFDDRVNREVKIDDIKLGHIRDFLVESNSALADDVCSRSIENTLLSLEVANATDGGVDIRNIAGLMFTERPEKFIPCAQIELVWFNTPNVSAERSLIYSEISAISSDKPSMISDISAISSNRELEIISFLKNRGRAKTMDLASLLIAPTTKYCVSRRSLRRSALLLKALHTTSMRGFSATHIDGNPRRFDATFNCRRNKLSQPRIRELLQPLIESGIVEKCGDKKGTYYRLSK